MNSFHPNVNGEPMVPWWLALIAFGFGAVVGVGLVAVPIWLACRQPTGPFR